MMDETLMQSDGEDGGPRAPGALTSSTEEPGLGNDQAVQITFTPQTAAKASAGICSASSWLALLLFLVVPWVVVSCEGREAATQSGAQILIGHASIDEAFADGPGDSPDDESDVGPALILVLFPIGLIIAGISGARIAIGRTPLSSRAAIAGAGLALLILATYLVFDFPIENAVQKELAEEGDAMARAMIDTERTAWLSFEVILCFLATVAAAVPLWLSRSHSSSLTRRPPSGEPSGV